MRVHATLRALCAGLVIWIAGALPAWSSTRHVFLLYDERLDLPGLAALDGDIVRTLTADSPDPIEVYREAMDLSRFPSDKYCLLLRDFLRAKYANKKIDVAIAILGPSLDFLLEYGAEIFPETPIVFCGVDRRELGGRSLPPPRPRGPYQTAVRTHPRHSVKGPSGHESHRCRRWHIGVRQAASRPGTGRVPSV